MALAAVPSLDELARDPALAAGLGSDVVTALSLRAHAVCAALDHAQRLAVAGNGNPQIPEPADRLLSVEQAAQLLGVERRWLYQRAKRIPGAQRLSRRCLRFSERRLKAWIEAERMEGA